MSDSEHLSEPDSDESLAAKVARLEQANAELVQINSSQQLKIKELSSALDQLHDSLPFYVVHKDLGGRFTYANPSFSDLAGLPVEKIIGKTDFDLSPPELAEKYQAEDRETIESGKTFETVEKSRIGGRKMYTLTLKRPLLNLAGEVRGIQVMLWDVTQLKELEKELHRSNTELIQFAYVASHDLQEPLRAVKNFCELLQLNCGSQIDEQGKIFIERILNGTERMQRLINDLLAYSKLQTEATPFQLVDIEKICEEAVQMLRIAIRECQGTVRTTGELPVVMGDRGQLLQLIENLIGNAIKYRREGVPPEILISAELTEDTWIFSIKDNGMGIPPESREKVFEVFRRLHGRDEYSGSGIGLAKCERVVRRHGGKIWVEELPGGNVGSLFKFTIPSQAIPTLDTHYVKLPSLVD